MLIELKSVQKTYATLAGVTHRALAGVSLTFDDTGLVFLVGASGCGKSTLLNVIGGMDKIDSGDVVLASRSLKEMSSKETDSLRNTLMGFVFQEFNLIDSLTVYENVKLPLDLQSEKDTREKVNGALAQLGILDKANNKTKDLSGGQRQRVALARALIKNPRIILADEPTGSLDCATGEEVFKILKELSKERLIIVVSHDMDRALFYGDRIVEMKDGRIYRDVRKRISGEEKIVSNVEFVSDSLIIAGKDKTLSQHDADKLKEILAESSRKTYLNFETDPRKVKALFPNLRESVDAAVSGEGEAEKGDELSDNFVAFKPRDTEARTVELKKNRLPMKNVLRLGLNNLNLKKGRLVLTLIMAIIAFALFSLSLSFSYFDKPAAISKTLIKENYCAAVFAKSSNFGRVKRIMQDESYHMLSQKYGTHFLQYSSAGYEIGDETFEGFIEIDDVSALGLKMLAGSGKIDDFQTAVIPQTMAEAMLKSGANYGLELSDLIGQTVFLNGVQIKIGGVFECFDPYIDRLPSDEKDYQLTLKKNSGWGQFYVKTGFNENYAVNANYVRLDLNLKIEYDSFSSSEVKSQVIVLKDGLPDGYSVDFGGIVGGSDKLIDKHDIFLSGSASFLDLFKITTRQADSLGGNQTADQINADASRRLTISNFDFPPSPLYATGNFRIRGFTGPVDENGAKRTNFTQNNAVDENWFYPEESSAPSNTIMITSAAFQELFSNMSYPVQMYLPLSGSALSAESMVKDFYKSGYMLSQGFASDYEFMEDFMAVMRYILLAVSLLLCLLVIFLIFNFISTSIRLTKKHIGILRALGAKKTDTFMIYAMEGLLVMALAFGITAVLLLVGPPLLNVLLSAVFKYYFSIFNIAWFIYFVLALLAVTVSAAGALISIGKFNRVSPIEAISSRE